MSYFRPVQTCSHCGCENPDGIAYCRDCGMTLRAPAPRVAAPTPTPELAAAAGLLPYPPAAPAQGFAPSAPPATPAPVAPPYAPAPAFAAPMPYPAPAVAPAAASPAAGNTLRSAETHQTEVPCPRCHERNPVESRFCHSCGFAVGSAAVGGFSPAPPPAAAVAPAVVPPAAAPPPAASPAAPPVCGRCRGTNEAGSDFCKFCGARLSAAEARPPEPVAYPGNLSQAAADGPIPMRTAMVVETRAGQVSNVAPANIAVAPPIVAAGAGAEPSGELVRATLVRIAKDGSEGVRHPITADVTDVGRTEGQVLLPDDPYLSPRHARIVARPAGAGVTIIDLASTNGVFVRLRAPYALVHGDLLLLGQQVLRFEAVTEIEGARGPAMQHGVLLFGSPAPATRGRLVQRTVEGLVRDVLYLVRDEMVFGRESGDRTFPDDVFMSRRHAVIRRENNGFALHDLGSSNGTFVQVHGEHPLGDSDQFRIGHHLFRVDVPAGGQTAYSPAAPAAGAGGAS